MRKFDSCWDILACRATRNAARAGTRDRGRGSGVARRRNDTRTHPDGKQRSSQRKASFVVQTSPDTSTAAQKFACRIGQDTSISELMNASEFTFGRAGTVQPRSLRNSILPELSTATHFCCCGQDASIGAFASESIAVGRDQPELVRTTVRPRRSIAAQKWMPTHEIVVKGDVSTGLRADQ